MSWVQTFKIEVTGAGLTWVDPHQATHFNGDKVYEWVSTDRKRTLAIYVDKNEGATFVRSWGMSVINEMDDGQVTEANQLDLWRWFVG